MSRLVIGATAPEISLLVDSLNARREKPAFDCDVYHASLQGKDAYIIRSGPGIANAAAATALALDRYRISHVYNVGICGVYSHDRNLLARVVVGVNAVFADTGVATDDAFLPLEAIDLPLARLRDGTKLLNIIPLNHDHIPRDITRCDFSTVSIVSGSRHIAEKVRHRFKVDRGMLLCEDMESAAVGLIAAKAGLPCTVFRGISNLCGDRDHSAWKLEEAAAAAQTTLLKFL
jgi:futalosine hydrolase